MIVLGIDPDLHHTALAWVVVEHLGSPTPRVKVEEIRIVHVPEPKQGGPKGQEAAVEMLRELRYLWSSYDRDPMHPSMRFVKVVAEGQQVYKRKLSAKKGRADGRAEGGAGKVDPAHLLRLALVSGAAMAGALDRIPAAEAVVPLPAEWKGTVPKDVYHADVCTALGWSWDVGGSRREPRIVPRGAGVVPLLNQRGRPAPSSAWIHALDAIGLALWGVSSVWRSVLVDRPGRGSVPRPPDPDGLLSAGRT
ncbi:MAG: hypothetical protein IT371_30870 [Deltaproteobacteria bacterium]|nr:hypothetical protein [Deltaproteobacteria bacterium]